MCNRPVAIPGGDGQPWGCPGGRQLPLLGSSHAYIRRGGAARMSTSRALVLVLQCQGRADSALVGSKIERQKKNRKAKNR